MFGRSLVGELRFARVEQAACDHAPFGPPRVGLDEVFGAAHLAEDFGGFDGLVGAAQHLHARERIARVLAHRGRHRVHQLGGVRLAMHRAARLRQRHVILADEFGGAHRGGVLALVEHPRRAEAVIRCVQHVAELLADGAFRPRAQIILAPRLLHQRFGFGLAAGGDVRAGERDAPGGRGGRALGEAFAHERVRRLADVERVLEARLQEAGRRPVGIAVDEGGEPLMPGGLGLQAQRRPFQRRAAEFVRCALRGLVALGEIACAIGGDGGAQRGGVGAFGQRRQGGRLRRTGRRDLGRKLRSRRVGRGRRQVGGLRRSAARRRRDRADGVGGGRGGRQGRHDRGLGVGARPLARARTFGRPVAWPRAKRRPQARRRRGRGRCRDAGRGSPGRSGRGRSQAWAQPRLRR